MKETLKVVSAKVSPFRIELVEFGGRVHLVSQLGGDEHTLCGNACDAADSERDEGLRWRKPRKGRKIDCYDCVREIGACLLAAIIVDDGVRRSVMAARPNEPRKK